MDRLEEIFKMQNELNLKSNKEWENLLSFPDDEELVKKWVKKYSHATAKELNELEDSVGWKWWKKHPDWDEDNIHNVSVELIDAFHFLVSAMQVMKITPDYLYNLYVKKNQLNHDRQDNGYKEGTYQKIDEHGKEDNYYLKDQKSQDESN